jgi:hypothetical protein
MTAGSADMVANPVAVSEFIREYLNNGMSVYDVDRRRFGTVADYDWAGRCFVVRTTAPNAALCIPLDLVTKVRRRKVYLSKSVRELSGRLRSSAPERGWLSSTLFRWFR